MKANRTIHLGMSWLIGVGLLITLPNLASAQWRATEGPYLGGECNNLTVLGEKLWLTIYPYPFTSADNGDHWVRIDTLDSESRFVASGNNLYNGGRSGLWRSTDNGAHWTNIYTGMSFSMLNTLLEKDGMLFFAAGYNGMGGLQRLSQNNTVLTDIWKPTGFLLHVAAIAQKDSFLIVGEQYRRGVYVSSDNGETWEERNTGLSPMAVATVSSIAVKGSEIYLGTGEGGAYKSTNNGLSWSPIDNGQFSWGAYISIMGDVLFVSGGNDIFRSTDNGNSWSNISAVLPREWRTPVVVRGTTIYTTTSDGLQYSVDSGRVWRRPMNIGLRKTDVGRLTYARFAGSTGRGILYASAGTSGARRGLWATMNGGIEWLQPIVGRLIWNPVFLIDSTQWYFVGSDGGLLMTSGDQGASWRTVVGTPASLWGVFTSLVRIDSVFLACAWYSTILYRKNMSDSLWQEITSPAKGAEKPILFVQGERVFLSAGNGSLYVSTDRGDSWKRTGETILKAILSYTASGSSIFVGTKGAGVFRSTDNGTAWLKSGSGLTDSIITALHAEGQIVFAGTDVGGVYCSLDEGLSWHAFSDGLGTDAVNALTSDGENLYAAIAQKGVWVRPLDELTSVTEDVAGTPDAYVLAQNYPNPFNPTTTIRYSLPARSRVHLAVYNTLGQQIAVLENGEQDAGYHEVRFDGTNLSTGIYFYRMQAGMFTETKKLLLVR